MINAPFLRHKKRSATFQRRTLRLFFGKFEK
ncbi:hypothetical protein EPYR_02303 [Erwinia pyrifoliae DSM 12163]|nr:hypothetical protein EPYR_02303 [Erwinia pyrifoliae DSM 12163]